MKVFLVHRRAWGDDLKIVRAPDAAAARALAGCRESASVDAIELDPEGDQAVLWEHEYSPDSDW